MWINLTPEEIEQIVRALTIIDDDMKIEGTRHLRMKFADWEKSQQGREYIIQAAVARYEIGHPWTDGDIDIDEDAIVSVSDEGAYVMGWFWVNFDREGINPDDEEGGEDDRN